jgi:hypothetical protein
MQTTKDGVTYLANGPCPINSDKSYQYLLVRMLIGAIQISKGASGLHQKIDFSTLPYCSQSKINAGAFNDFLSSSNLGGNSKRFVMVTLSDNRDFFRELLAELANYFIQTKRGNHATAFVHLYRAFERILYSVPLLYSSTQKDYIGTFNDLKLLFKEDISGELGLFKKFLGLGKFIDRIKLETPSTITFTSNFGHEVYYYKLTNRLYKGFQSLDPLGNQVSLKFKDTPELISTLRNRLFHARTGDGKSNAKMQEIIDIDEYLSCLNPTFCNFISIIILQTISTKYQI